MPKATSAVQKKTTDVHRLQPPSSLFNICRIDFIVETELKPSWTGNLSSDGKLI